MNIRVIAGLLISQANLWVLAPEGLQALVEGEKPDAIAIAAGNPTVFDEAAREAPDHFEKVASFLSHTNLSGGSLTGADLIDADFSAATLSGITWNNTTCPNETNSNSYGNTCIGHLLLPTITASAKKADNTAYSAGSWTTQNVTVHFTCTPAAGRTSESCPADQAYTNAGSFTANGNSRRYGWLFQRPELWPDSN